MKEKRTNYTPKDAEYEDRIRRFFLSLSDMQKQTPKHLSLNTKREKL